MRKNFGAKPCIYPMPVLIVAAYDENGVANAMNAAWGGITEEAEITICLSPEHKTTENIQKSGAFTVSMATAQYVKECDYLGIVSGNDVSAKLSHIGFHTTRSEQVNAPIIDELPMALECKLVSYDSESCRLVAEIVNVSAEESILNEKGKIDPKKLNPITYDSMNHAYLTLGEQIGKAFSDGLSLK